MQPNSTLFERLRRWVVVIGLGAITSICAQSQITWKDYTAFRQGRIQIDPPYLPGVVTLEESDAISGPWRPLVSRFSLASESQFSIAWSGEIKFRRARWLNWSDPVRGFSNFIESYSQLSTLAGAGGSSGTDNKWQPSFEGGLATAALLSRPHIALGDRSGTIYIADKEGHAIRRVDLDGTIHTHAGTSIAGNGPDTPTPAREVALKQPNGCWVTADGTVFILDLGNAKVRKVTPNGICETLFVVPGGWNTGRGLWVSDDETRVYLSAGTVVKKWTPTSGVIDIPASFVDLGNLAVNSEGRLAVTDRGAHRVYWLSDTGEKTPLAGNGQSSGGGDGKPALETGLNEVRGVWFTPGGGVLLATAGGAQVWWVDSHGIIHLILHGARSVQTHAGDGEWFYQPDQPRMSEARSVTMDRQGNLLTTENDAGYVRKIRLFPHQISPP